MARMNAAMGMSVCGMMMMVMIMGAAAQAPAPSVDCTTVVLTLSDCLGYVTGTDKTPPAACCTELSSVVKSNPQCLCLLYNTTFVEPLGVNVTLALQLPSKCNVQTPPTSLCALVGIPVPGPVSSTSPVMAPSPASKKAPASTPAVSPMAPSSSPTPVMASSPSPTTTAPTGSMSPGVSPTATEPSNSTTSTSPPSSPSSAHVITSWNAGAAASLFLLASIFLS